MFLLDTNIVSMLDRRRREFEPRLIDWLDANGGSLFLSVMTIAELDAGVLKLRREGKSARADEIAGLVDAILADFGDRVLPMDTETARHLARLGAATYRQPVALPDLIIAATAVRHGLTVVTRNVGEFGRLGVMVWAGAGGVRGPLSVPQLAKGNTFSDRLATLGAPDSTFQKHALIDARQGRSTTSHRAQ